MDFISYAFFLSRATPRELRLLSCISIARELVALVVIVLLTKMSVGSIICIIMCMANISVSIFSLRSLTLSLSNALRPLARALAFAFAFT